MHGIKFEMTSAVKINAPGWYKRQDWLDFIDGKRASNGRPPAGWHVPGDPPGDYSDVFFTFDHGEGCEQDAIPEDIWREIVWICGALGITDGLIWVTNLEGA